MGQKTLADEIADIQIYLARIADVLRVDIGSAVYRKLEINERRYPAHQVKGSSKKYSHYDENDSAQ